MADNQPTLFDSEIWKPVAGYEGAYEVSDLGRVRGVDRLLSDGRKWKGKLLKSSDNGFGYLQVLLASGGVQRAKYVHRLVADAFLGACPEGMQVDHADNDRKNNRLNNLRYMTAWENTVRQLDFGNSPADRVANGTHHETRKKICPRGHKLELPNLVPSNLKHGRRSCLACSRGRARVQNFPHLKPDLQAVTDSYYQTIMSSSIPPQSA